MTVRLYLTDPHLTRFDAQVVARRTLKDRPAVVLSRTAFYPEGGGQPADRGTLSGVRVVDVQEVDGDVLHILDGDAPEGQVQGEVDWDRRLDHMQQHHGQHLLSAAFKKVLDANTVSMHIGEETCTIDLTVPVSRLDGTALRQVEAACNASIWRDLEVIARDFTGEERAQLSLRKDAVKGDRVVLVEGVDASPCGGTHPRRTGEVGSVAVLRAQKWGEGSSRVEFICGRRVVAALAVAAERLAAAGKTLQCSAAEVPQAAARLATENVARRKEVDRLAASLARSHAERLAGQARSGIVAAVVKPEGGGAMAYLKALGAALVEQGLTALLAAEEEGRAQLFFSRPRGPGARLDAVLKEVAQRVGGKGGGSPESAQGSGPQVTALREALEWAAAELTGQVNPGSGSA